MKCGRKTGRKGSCLRSKTNLLMPLMINTFVCKLALE